MELDLLGNCAIIIAENTKKNIEVLEEHLTLHISDSLFVLA